LLSSISSVRVELILAGNTNVTGKDQGLHKGTICLRKVRKPMQSFSDDSSFLSQSINLIHPEKM